MTSVINEKFLAVIHAAQDAVVAENASFDYVASNAEIATDIWHNHMTPFERLEFVQLFTNESLVIERRYDLALWLIENSLK
ncbi:hypothetical protein OLCHANIL_00128 [Vibrio phage V05]|uniref:Uncharacterized protein n=3 Tax=Schizotequatrovirus KVP40 TaxID=1914019 RepID=A0A6B9STE4_9CAUD|nr:hypothetical protein pp2_197 [Vibrio phage phi-pp2]QHJ74383.1 hypothetical protein VH12019_00056 [Vibrio phage VH1_2019]QIW90225.1 hypothetical protein OLCHANIL_00128 [Vibrio phage V05]QIW91213.1 hypothetical protein COHAPHLL_00377 [Vibrio phage V09]UNA01716.1 hypothetical protein [Vibrio phage PC-Liy1]URQ03012.1 hypothetical protein PVA8_26 [Vibrio phage PVA8]WBM58748.1 hypothetical protein vBValMPVA8_26 [Vibrio phage vB_ValM_PVA8]